MSQTSAPRTASLSHADIHFYIGLGMAFPLLFLWAFSMAALMPEHDPVQAAGGLVLFPAVLILLYRFTPFLPSIRLLFGRIGAGADAVAARLTALPKPAATGLLAALVLAPSAVSFGVQVWLATGSSKASVLRDVREASLAIDGALLGAEFEPADSALIVGLRPFPSNPLQAQTLGLHDPAMILRYPLPWSSRTQTLKDQLVADAAAFLQAQRPAHAIDVGERVLLNHRPNGATVRDLASLSVTGLVGLHPLDGIGRAVLAFLFPAVVLVLCLGGDTAQQRFKRSLLALLPALAAALLPLQWLALH